MEQDRKVWNTLETTVSYKIRARLTPTLTHVVTYELVTSGVEDRAMSAMRQETQLAVLGTVVRVLYTVQSIRNVLHYDARWKVPESYRN